ncbi:hypothetical protein [Dysgonomonas termitidis]|uniref:Capsid protein n=1 Tax=Dysgonomonas termitidis TaxID=1516126 RepID=A0ABV9KTK0_9BACT
MGTSSPGQHLTQYVAPQLLQEFRNYKDDFIGVIPGAPKKAISADGLRYNKLINNVGFYVNNVTAFNPQKMNGEKVIVPWEWYDTDPTEVDDDEIRALPYDKRAEVRVKHTEAFKIGIRDHTMWKLCPEDSDNPNMPVMRTTGNNDGTGRKRCTFRDVVEYLEMVKDLNLPLVDQLNLILNAKHSTDLILDRDAAPYFSNKEIFFDVRTGKVKSVMGFKFFDNNAAPLFDADGNKKPKGSVKIAGDQYASTFFYAPNAVYHLDSVKILYKDEHTDTRNAHPTSEFRTQTYGLVDRVVDYGFGAIVSGNS